MPINGLFIAVESIDPFDCTTFSKAISQWLIGKAIRNVLIADPHGNIEVSETIRSLVASCDNFKSFEAAMVDLLLRRAYLNTVVSPTLQQGTWVVVAGFSDMTYCDAVVQGSTLYRVLAKAESMTMEGCLSPDVVFVVDTSFSDSYKRAVQNDDSFVLSAHEQTLRRNYNRKRAELLIRAAAQPKTHVVVDHSDDYTETLRTMQDFLCGMGVIPSVSTQPMGTVL